MGRSNLDRYIFLGIEADQYLGRLLAFLNPKSIDFAVLPPHFDGSSSQMRRVSMAVNECFGGLVRKSSTMPGVLQFCLASVVYHARDGGWLRKNLHEGVYIFIIIIVYSMWCGLYNVTNHYWRWTVYNTDRIIAAF